MASEAERRHLKRTALIGAGAGATSLGGARYLLARDFLGKKYATAAAIGSALRGSLIGGTAGLGVGLLTKPNRRRELSAKLDYLIQFAADTRPRNDWGQFTQQEGGPDPNAMYRTYHAPQPQQGPGLGKIAVTAAVGSVAGAGALEGSKALVEKLRKVKLGKLG